MASYVAFARALCSQRSAIRPTTARLPHGWFRCVPRRHRARGGANPGVFGDFQFRLTSGSRPTPSKTNSTFWRNVGFPTLHRIDRRGIRHFWASWCQMDGLDAQWLQGRQTGCVERLIVVGERTPEGRRGSSGLYCHLWNRCSGQGGDDRLKKETHLRGDTRLLPLAALRHPCCPINPCHPYLPKRAKGPENDASTMVSIN